MGRHERRVTQVFEAVAGHVATTQPGFQHSFRVDICTDVPSGPMLGQMAHLGDKTWWVEHFSRPPSVEALLGVRAKFATIEAKSERDKWKTSVLLVLSEGSPRTLEEYWCGLQMRSGATGIWEMLGAIPTYWVDTKRVSPEYFPLASLALDPDPESNWGRVAEAMVRAQALGDNAEEQLWEVLMGAVQYHSQERFVDQLRRSRLEGREQGLEEGREQGLEEGREQGLEEGREQGLEEGREQGLEEGREQGLIQTLTAVLASRFGSTYAWQDAIQKTGARSIDLFADTLAAESAEEAIAALNALSEA